MLKTEHNRKWNIVGEPITTESRVRVESEDGQQGYRSLRWTHGQAKPYGSVYEILDYYDEYGNRTRESESFIIDRHPKS